MHMLPTVFLSLSGTDDNFVGKVHDLLPDGLAYFYPKSFANGENLIQAMDDRVPASSIFVLFASAESARSVWVNVEIDLARIEKIKRNNFTVLVFPIDTEVQPSDLPRWMRDYWIPRAGLSPRDVARYVRKKISTLSSDQLKAAQVFGRGGLVDKAVRDVQDAVFRHGESPNVFLLAGNDGIGRRTFSAEFLRRSFPALPDIQYGPVFNLPQFADIEDIYRYLRQEIETDFSISGFTQDLKHFRDLGLEDQVEEVMICLDHFGDLGSGLIARRAR